MGINHTHAATTQQHRQTTVRAPHRLHALLLTGALLVVGYGSTVWAVDGVIEINQTSAMAGELFGDAPGFPITLALRGSYRLTSELNVPAGLNGIEFQNDSISLDLNGFAIVGGGGAGGIGVSSPGRASDIRVFNGTIRLMPTAGIQIGSESRVDNVTLIANGIGLEVDSNSIVTRCTAVANNGTHAFLIGTNSHVTENIATDNDNVGIQVESGYVSNNIARGNGGDGITAGQASTVTNNTSSLNGGRGLVVTTGAVIGNTSRGNTGLGLQGSTSVAYSNNVFTANNSNGNQTSGGVQLGTNFCNGDTICP